MYQNARGHAMPYKSVKDLPDRVRENLPEHAQEIYRAAFNNAWDEYKEPGERKKGGTREETAHAVAWSAVEQEYTKDEKSGEWVKKKD
jgi:cation transport regulator